MTTDYKITELVWTQQPRKCQDNYRRPETKEDFSKRCRSITVASVQWKCIKVATVAFIVLNNSYKKCCPASLPGSIFCYP